MSLSTNAGPQRGAASRSEKAKSPFHRTQPILGLIVDDCFGAKPEAAVSKIAFRSAPIPAVSRLGRWADQAMVPSIGFAFFSRSLVLRRRTGAGRHCCQPRRPGRQVRQTANEYHDGRSWILLNVFLSDIPQVPENIRLS
jgi:hypothetical protein